MIITSLKIFVFSSLINLLWEVSHSGLYKTCQKSPLNKYVIRILRASFFDGLWITIFYLLTIFIFNNVNIINNMYQIFLFIILALLYAFICEKISLKHKRWEYTNKMPTIFRVGVTPLFQLAITGLLTFLFVFLM